MQPMLRPYEPGTGQFTSTPLTNATNGGSIWNEKKIVALPTMAHTTWDWDWVIVRGNNVDWIRLIARLKSSGVRLFGTIDQCCDFVKALMGIGSKWKSITNLPSGCKLPTKNVRFIGIYCFFLVLYRHSFGSLKVHILLCVQPTILTYFRGNIYGAVKRIIKLYEYWRSN